MAHSPTSQTSFCITDVVLAIVLAATSGVAILAYAFGSVPMTLSVPFVVMPTVLMLVCAVLLRQRLYSRFRALADLVWLGAWTGFLATVGYDVIRPVVQRALRFDFNPFAAIPVFGQLITGLPPESQTAVAAGWAYHFWNGISFGMMFALWRPKGGIAAGCLWGLGLECLMLITYPALLRLRLDDPGFLVTSIVGHSLWGALLGAGIARWGHG
jgi:hypothetical protein